MIGMQNRGKQRQVGKAPLDAAQIHELICGLSGGHILKNGPQSYVQGFVTATLEVYEAAKLRKVLQRKFFIPDESNYTDEAYYQSASELSISRHLKRKETKGLLNNLEYDKRVNPGSLKDVDDYFSVKSTQVSLEVKCPLEEKQASSSGNITLRTAGRTPNHIQKFKKLKKAIGSGKSGTKLVQGKNTDLRLKDCLVSANEKFSSQSSVGVWIPSKKQFMDDLNILFLSCGHFYRMSEWYMCLYGGQGLFGPQSFHPPATYSNVDVVILSSLKYRHEYVRDFSAWSLDDVFLLPIVNPHSRSSNTSDAIKQGLSVFDHLLTEFASFNPGHLIVDEHSENRKAIKEMLKINHFVMEHLAPAERSRFFPVTLNS